MNMLARVQRLCVCILYGQIWRDVFHQLAELVVSGLSGKTKANVRAAFFALALCLFYIALQVQAQEEPRQLHRGCAPNDNTVTNAMPCITVTFKSAHRTVKEGKSDEPRSTPTNNSPDNANNPVKLAPMLPGGLIEKLLNPYNNDRFVKYMITIFNPSQ